eukprot:CAMPEP_0206572850 /NCGR_PEP_ID=MMETSP0325_2-20121206/28504_1 /ASSEMBLY_ACC=CAM_ASM_000347 /TAXON_ID=2866 /ORGANISM="Crypthecodinium cohnii, Strain Seligo" /LENGTH=512 /DNA_ID=CAMNT_0054077159 /DNA_START=40 /DNA_END=1578 /DNA_ORIENTATION=+
MELKHMALIGGGGLCGIITLLGLIFVCMILGSIKTLGPEEQMVVYYLDGKDVVNGPSTKVYNPFRDIEKRNAVRIGELEYARIKDTLNGGVRMVEGHAKIFLGAYEVVDGIYEKIVLKKDQYIRLIDRLTGVERVVEGSDSITPGAWEESSDGVQSAYFINRDSAVLVLNKGDGTKRLETTAGVFFPDSYEVVEETRTLVRVLPYETMVVRDAYGRYQIMSGAGEDGSGSGNSFFLGPFEAIVEMEWSTFSEPADGEIQVISSETLTRIDMRARKVFYQYDVRTNDNVALRIEGTIFWQVVDVAALLEMTADPVGDVWYKARNALISAVSQVNFETFMSSFNTLITNAFLAQASDGFYSDRGIEVQSMEVTKYDCTDEETAATLQEIIEETTNRINRLQAQKSENDVKAAKLTADIELEINRTTLIQTQATNERLVATHEGEATGIQLAMAATTFIDSLNDTLPDLDQRLELYKLHKSLENQNARTKHLSSAKATLFLTPDDMNLALNTDEL